MELETDISKMEPVETIPQEQQPFDIEQIDKMAPERAALAWENFLKRIGARMPENKARETLLAELKEAATKKGKSVDIASSLWNPPVANIEKLKKYLSGEYHISDIRTYEELAGGSRSH